MLSMVDCIAFSGLTPEQLEAVANHRHIPAIVAAEWAETVMEQCDGCDEVEEVLAEEAHLAHEHHRPCATERDHALEEFRHDHHASESLAKAAE